jgi:hypothetical protein
MLESNPWGLPKTLILTDDAEVNNNVIASLLSKNVVIASKSGELNYGNKVKLQNGYYLYGLYKSWGVNSRNYSYLERFHKVKRKLAYGAKQDSIGDTLLVTNFRENNYYNVKGISLEQFKKDFLDRDYSFILFDTQIRYSDVDHFKSAAIALGYVVVGFYNNHLMFAKGEAEND